MHLRLCEAPVHSGQVIMHAKTKRLDCAVLHPITHGDLLDLWLPWLDWETGVSSRRFMFRAPHSECLLVEMQA